MNRPAMNGSRISDSSHKNRMNTNSAASQNTICRWKVVPPGAG